MITEHLCSFTRQSYGPLFPFAEYTLLNSMLTSVGCYVGIALIFVIFVFPETLSHAYLDSSAVLLQKSKGLLALQDEVLRADPRDVLPGTPLAGKVNGASVGIIMQLQQRMWFSLPRLYCYAVPAC